MLSFENESASASKWLRLAVFLVGGLETTAVLILLGTVVSSGQLTSGEALSRSLGWTIVIIYGVPYLALVVPSLILAAFNRSLPVAFALCILVVPLTFLAFWYA